MKCPFNTYVVLALLCVGLASNVRLNAQGGQKTPRQSTAEQAEGKPLFEVTVEDADEAALIEQQLKIKPVLLRDHSFFYYGDARSNETLRKYGYSPAPVKADDVFTQTVQVVRRGGERQLKEAGVTVILREQTYWVVRGTRAQIRMLGRLGYQVRPLGRREPRPRQIRLTVKSQEQVAEVGAHRVDIFEVKREGDSYIIAGTAFDDVIDELRALGYQPQVKPYPVVHP